MASEPGDVLFETDYLTVRAHDADGRVGVATGRTEADRTPTVVDAVDLKDALTGYLDGLEVDDA